MSVYDKITKPENLKKEFTQVMFFVLLYENFKSNWENELLSFYSNSVYFENGKAIYRFTKPNPNNNKAFSDCDFVKDSIAEEEYKDEVYRTIKKSSGNGNDREASLFHWLLDHTIITQSHYEKLIEFRELRNKLVHNYDEFLNSDLPVDIDSYIIELIEIRKYASKEWFLQVEFPTSGDAKFDENGKVIIPEFVFSNVDLTFDLLYDSLFK